MVEYARFLAKFFYTTSNDLRFAGGGRSAEVMKFKGTKSQEGNVWRLGLERFLGPKIPALLGEFDKLRILGASKWFQMVILSYLHRPHYNFRVHWRKESALYVACFVL